MLAAVHPLARLGPSGLGLASSRDQAGLAFVLAFVSASMYYCLSEWTGAVPAEYFSAQKRAGYAEYQRTTSMIVPWAVKPAVPEEKVGEVLGTVKKAFDKLKAKAEKAKEERGRSKTPAKKEAARARSKTPVRKEAKARSKTPTKRTPAKKASPAATRSARKKKN